MLLQFDLYFYFVPIDIYGQVLQDFYNHQPKEKLWLHNNYGKPEEMPIEVFFRGEGEMPETEWECFFYHLKFSISFSPKNYLKKYLFYTKPFIY